MYLLAWVTSCPSNILSKRAQDPARSPRRGCSTPGMLFEFRPNIVPTPGSCAHVPRTEPDRTLIRRIESGICVPNFPQCTCLHVRATARRGPYRVPSVYVYASPQIRLAYLHPGVGDLAGPQARQRSCADCDTHLATHGMDVGMHAGVRRPERRYGVVLYYNSTLAAACSRTRADQSHRS